MMNFPVCFFFFCFFCFCFFFFCTEKKIMKKNGNRSCACWLPSSLLLVVYLHGFDAFLTHLSVFPKNPSCFENLVLISRHKVFSFFFYPSFLNQCNHQNVLAWLKLVDRDKERNDDIRSLNSEGFGVANADSGLEFGIVWKNRHHWFVGIIKSALVGTWNLDRSSEVHWPL